MWPPLIKIHLYTNELRLKQQAADGGANTKRPPPEELKRKMFPLHIFLWSEGEGGAAEKGGIKILIFQVYVTQQFHKTELE